MGEQERESAGAARSQHVVLHGPADRRTMAAAMRPGIERSRDLTTAQPASPRCLVVVPTVEQGLTAAEGARALLADDNARVVPVSAVVRARRVLAAAPVAVVVGTAADLLALRRDSALRMDDVQAVVMIALDETLAEGGAETLQALLADAPDGAMRVASLDDESEAIDAFLEAQLRRARHIGAPPAGEGALPMTPSYAVTTAAGRAETLRAILDALDPPSLVVIAPSDAGADSATAALRRIGVPADGSSVQVVRQPTAQHVALIVLWESLSSTEALTEALAARPVDLIALLLPDEVPAFRRLTGGTATPWTPPARKESAEGRVRATRAALVSALEQAGGPSASELALLEPLLDRHDAVELAAAALRLFERAQRDAKRDAERFAERMRTAGAAARAQGGRDGGRDAGARGGLTVVNGGARPQRVFLGVGKRDGARVGDIVGAIANEAGIPGDRIGTVELFESHAIVELSAEDATATVTALESAMLRGRRLGARLDDRAGFGGRGDRPERGARPAGPRGTREGREPRGAPRTGAPRGAAPRGDRPPRPDSRGDSRGPSRDAGPRGPGRPAGRPAPRGDGAPGARGDARGDAPGGGRPPRAPRGDEVKRAFGDRPASERTEGRSEWSERASRMNNARRPVRPPAADRNDEE